MGLTLSHNQSGSYVLLLAEENNNRRLPIVIGGFEAQAIAVELENLKPARPLTHDLMRDICKEFDIRITEVVIYNIKESVFHSKIICTDGTTVKEIDARTSDAIALALRFKCNVYTYEFIMEQAGVVIEDDKEKEPKATPAKVSSSKPESKSNNLQSMSNDELQENLMKAIDEEAYERASQIRDELQRRKNN